MNLFSKCLIMMGLFSSSYFSIARASAELIYFSGKIASAPIFMKLDLENQKISGEYFYTRYKKPIPLHGSEEGNNIKLLAVDEIFVGSFLKKAFDGSWQLLTNKGKSKKELAFTLVRTSQRAFDLARCLEDPKEDAGRNCRHLGGAQVEGLADVDGDGKEETLTACRNQCGATGNCSFELFLSNHGCFKRAGILGGPSKLIKILKSVHKGVSDLSTYWKGGCTGREGAYAELQYDGISYQISRTVKCECPKSESDIRPPECP